ncbi:unnamed protein product, partial [Ectocarpus sp. 13 AM-2016]
ASYYGSTPWPSRLNNRRQTAGKGDDLFVLILKGGWSQLCPLIFDRGYCYASDPAFRRLARCQRRGDSQEDIVPVVRVCLWCSAERLLADHHHKGRCSPLRTEAARSPPFFFAGEDTCSALAWLSTT